jgi:hypothetical protein
MTIKFRTVLGDSHKHNYLAELDNTLTNTLASSSIKTKDGKGGIIRKDLLGLTSAAVQTNEYSAHDIKYYITVAYYEDDESTFDQSIAAVGVPTGTDGEEEMMKE